MTKEEIEEYLWDLSPVNIHNYQNLVIAFNLALDIAAKKASVDLYTKGTYKGAKWRKLNEGDTYNPLERSVSAKLDKKSILKLKIK